MMLFGHHTFKQFLNSHEQIATNILADRLRRLEDYGIIASATDPADGR
jgi:DNA-binding HxlR family transcriptional regulator